MLGVERLGGTVLRGVLVEFVPPVIAPATMAVSEPVRRQTMTSLTEGHSRSASSTTDLSLTSFARRHPPSAVMTIAAPRSRMRALSASAEKPPKTTLWVMPSRAQASMAIAASGIIGM